MRIAQHKKVMSVSKRITGILLVACLGLAGIERADADQPCEGILCGSGAANRHAARTGFLVGLAQLGQDLARAVTDRIYNSTILGEDWFWGGMAESHNRSINEKFGDLVGEHNYIGPEEIPGMRVAGAEIFNNVAMEAATAGIVAGGPLAQRGLQALRRIPKWQRGAVDLGGITGGLGRTEGIIGDVSSASRMTMAIPLHQGGAVYPPSSRAGGSWSNKGSHFIGSKLSFNNSALSHGDSIRRINYANSRHAGIQLERMADAGETFNYVIVGRGSRHELLVAPKSGYTEELRGFPENGVKHVQLANGKPIIMGGEMRVSRNAVGYPTIYANNSTGTYGQHIRATDEKVDFTRDCIIESFHYYISMTDFTFQRVR